MKKKLVVVLLAVVMVFCFAACGGGDQYADSKYLGTWNATTVSMEGFEMEASSVFDSFALTLEASGKAEVDLNGETESGKWEESDTGIVLKDSTEEMEFTANEDGTLSVEYEGVSIIFEKAA